MDIEKIKHLAALVVAPLWVPLRAVQDRGHFLDGASQAMETLCRETRLRAKAHRIGLVRVNPFAKFPGIDCVNVRLVPGHWTSSHEQIEYPILAAIVSVLKPKRIFEFGTFLGEATLMFARASPDATVSTLNIPESAKPSLGISVVQASELLTNDQIGKLFRGQPEEMRIEQILCDSAVFDTSGHRAMYDFIWVDAGHSYENVVVDSAHAFEMVAPGGYVFWHDFDSNQPGVTSALNEIARKRKLFWIEKTSIIGYENRPLAER